MWGLSGLSHPIMTRLQPSPAAFMPPPQTLDLKASIPPRELLAQHGISQLQRLSVISLNQENYYRVGMEPSQPARYFSAVTGKELTDGDRQYAEQLASYYTGLPLANIHQSKLITGFSDDYHVLNRLLPVWHIEFAGEGHLRAFIDTDQARLATLVDDTRFYLTRFFRFGHNWSFAESVPLLQVSLMALVLAIALTSAGSGLYMYFSRRQHVSQRMANQPLRRWHRRLGLLVALSTLLFAGSGGFHLVMSFKQDMAARPAPAPTLVSASQLSDAVWRQITASPLARLDLITQGNRPLWLTRNTMPQAQVAMLAHEHHHHEHHAEVEAGPSPIQLVAANDSMNSVPRDLLALAKIKAASYANKPLAEIAGASLVESFGGEYGFIFKRLPVIKVQFRGAGSPRYYIEPATGALAAEVRDLDAVEGWSFATLHKWGFADFNKDFRDILVSLFALGNILVALMGLIMFSRRNS